MNWTDVAAVGTFIVGGLVAFWGYQRGKRSDEISEQSGIATETRQGTQQIIDGLNTFIDQLQESGTVYRETITYLEGRLTACSEQLGEATKALALMHKKYGNDDGA